MTATEEKARRSRFTHVNELLAWGYYVKFHPNAKHGTYEDSLDDVIEDLPPPDGLGFSRMNLGRSNIVHNTAVPHLGIEASFTKF
jgi:hypothetical protein